MAKSPASGKEEMKNGSKTDFLYADPNNSKLGRRLAYLLRYGAVKEGLKVTEKGFVKLSDMMMVPLFSVYTKETLITEFEKSTSERGKRRYEVETRKGEVFVRSIFGQQFERLPYHENTKVLRLLEICLQTVATNITNYSLDGFPDDFLLGDILHRLKRNKKLNNTTLECILSSEMQKLDLSDTYLTTGSLKMIMKTCPNLRILNLKYCGYLLNDELLMRLMKKLPYLKDLNVCKCTHLTSMSLRNMTKHLPSIQVLNIAQIKNFKEEDILKFLVDCTELRYLAIYQCSLPLTEDFCNKVDEICQSRPKLKVVKT
ncbi:uncharacterized protein [Asterias amurensis]|uniref:uncharacterized protein isoform X1 n=2 Tax=Asterias amurensis TaxID=7602 RepID=UPI003AB41373